MATANKNRLHLSKLNIILLIVAALLLVTGYVIMSFNEITISVLVLVFAYVFLIPFALLYHPINKDNDPSK